MHAKVHVHFKGSEEMPLALIVESLAVVVHHDPVEMAPDHGIGLLRSSVNELTMCTIWRAGGGCANFKSHLQTMTGVVYETRGDELELLSLGTNISGQHLFVAVNGLVSLVRYSWIGRHTLRSHHKQA